MKTIVNLPLQPVEYFPINFLIHANYFDDDINLFDLNWQFHKHIELYLYDLLEDIIIYPPPKNRNLCLRKNQSFLHYKQAVYTLEDLYKNKEDIFDSTLQQTTNVLTDYDEIFLVLNESKFSKIFLEKFISLYPEKKITILDDFPSLTLATLNLLNLNLRQYWYHGRVCEITSKNSKYLDLIAGSKLFDAIEFKNLDDVTRINDTTSVGSYLTLNNNLDQRLDYATLSITTNDIGTKFSTIENFFTLCRRNRIRLNLQITIDDHNLNSEKFFNLCKKFNIKEICQIYTKDVTKSLILNNVDFSKDFLNDFLHNLKKQKLLTQDVRSLHEFFIKTK